MTFADFFERVRSADEAAKRVWIAAGTILAMTFVITLWLTFFSPLTTGQDAATDQFSLGASLRGMTASVGESLRGFLGVLTEKLAAPKQYNITP